MKTVGAEIPGLPVDGMSRARITIAEIAERLAVGRCAVYEMLEKRIIPGIRLGRRWIISRHAYTNWENNCGVRQGLQ